MKASTDIIKLNVGGRKFQTLRSTLLSLEGTYFMGLLDCESPGGEYFIDRDGDKFAAVLEYFRGNRNVYIDPAEASFYALPLPSLPFHELVQKDVAFVRDFMTKYQYEILDDLIRFYKCNTEIEAQNLSSVWRELEENTVSWNLFPGMNWCAKESSLNRLCGYRKELWDSFVPGDPLFRALVTEAKSFWLSQGLFCTITVGRAQSKISFSWTSTGKGENRRVNNSIFHIEEMLSCSYDSTYRYLRVSGSV